MLDGYGVHPWQMERWTGRELEQLVAYERLMEQKRREAEGVRCRPGL